MTFGTTGSIQLQKSMKSLQQMFTEKSYKFLSSLFMKFFVDELYQHMRTSSIVMKRQRKWMVIAVIVISDLCHKVKLLTQC
jgi:hypothetical protein